MLIAIVLGNYLNDDQSMSDILYYRLKMAKEIIEKYNPYKVILSGGIANKKAGVAESVKMKEYLLEQGIDQDKIIVEDQSLSTKENAIYSLPICLSNKATDILVCSTIEHFTAQNYNVISIFQNELYKLVNDDINNYRLIFYTN